MAQRENNDIPYRAPVTAAPAQQPVTRDEENYDTLKLVRSLLAEGVAELDKWHAFDLKETDGLTMKQQIRAHEMAFTILDPLLSLVNNAMEKIDAKYRKL